MFVYLVNVKEGVHRDWECGASVFFIAYFLFFNIFGHYVIDRYVKRHCSSFDIFWVCSALSHPPACLVSFSSQHSFVAKSQKACLGEAAVIPRLQAAQ